MVKNILRIRRNFLNIELTGVGNEVEEFIRKITLPESGFVPITHTLEIRSGPHAKLQLDVEQKYSKLILPDPKTCNAGELAVKIAIIQAATRGLAAMGPVDKTWLLHGSAVSLPRRSSAVAILDGGRGQGKTSLALALAQAGAALLVDEFTFVSTENNEPHVIGLPRLPWHIRKDVASVLGLGTAGPALLYPQELGQTTTLVSDPIPLSHILIPDATTEAGFTFPISPESAPLFLATATLDHVAKLLNPTLDHVSIFSSPTDVQVRNYSDPDQEPILKALRRVRIFGVGIGKPGDLPKSAAAVARLGLL